MKTAEADGVPYEDVAAFMAEAFQEQRDLTASERQQHHIDRQQELEDWLGNDDDSDT